jgi:hypothetical protein
MTLIIKAQKGLPVGPGKVFQGKRLSACHVRHEAAQKNNSWLPSRQPVIGNPDVIGQG